MNKILKKWPNNLRTIKPEVYIAALSLVVSIYVVFSGERQYTAQRENTEKHDKLAVRPHLDLILHGDDHEKKLGLELVNDGIGPAEVTRQKFHLAGMTDSVETVQQLADHVIQRGLGFWRSKDKRDFSTFDLQGTFIPANKSYFVFAVDVDSMKSLDALLNCFDRFSCEYQYVDFYNDTFYAFYPRR